MSQDRWFVGGSLDLCAKLCALHRLTILIIPQLNTIIVKSSLFPIGSMYAIYGNIYHQYTPMLAYIPYMDPMGSGMVPNDTPNLKHSETMEFPMGIFLETQW